MTDRAEGILAIVASLLVLFSAMIDPRVSAALALVLLVGYAVYKLVFVKHA
jgi:hypothetical protein